MSIFSAAVRNRGLAFRLALSLLVCVSVVFVAAFSYNYHQSRKAILEGVERHARSLTQAALNRIEGMLSGVEQLPSYLALRLQDGDVTEEVLLSRIKTMVRATPAIFGVAVAYEPYGFEPDRLYYAPYVHRFRNESWISFKYLGSKEYQYFNHDWYLLARELDRPVWSEPYFDEEGGGVEMTTYSRPFYRALRGGGRTFSGVITAEVSMDWLQDMVSAITVYKTGFAFLMSRAGVFVTHPDKRIAMRESIFSLAEETGSPQLRDLGRDMIRGGSGFQEVDHPAFGGRSRVYYQPVPSTGWTFGVVVPEAELFSGLDALSRDVLLIGGVGLFLVLLVVTTISEAIVRPLRRLADNAAVISRGNLDDPLPTSPGGDEISALSRSFEGMRRALKNYIAGLTEATAARERIESEMKIARAIQMSFLPKIFPPFPERDEFAIHAVIEQAKDVGGDFYDFFLLDGPNGHQLFFSIGDVSDKGVPAALFMAVTKTLMKGVAESGIMPSEVLERVNAELCRENDTMMFVTVFCAVLDLATGDLWYASAGHNPPLLMPHGGSLAWLEPVQGLLLGVMEDVSYTTGHLRLSPGDRLLLYTDGVTEAMDADKGLFSPERLLATAAHLGGKEPEELTGSILRDVRLHTGGEPQSDDITLLAIRYKGQGQGK